MADNLVVEKKDQSILVHFPRYETLTLTEKHFATVFKICDKYKCYEVLVDGRAMREKIPILDLYDLACFIAEQNKGRHVTMAIVIMPDIAYTDRFGENVARNRGVNVMRFTDMNKASAWLRNERAS